jgi:hypothetical protein
MQYSAVTKVPAVLEEYATSFSGSVLVRIPVGHDDQRNQGQVQKSGAWVLVDFSESVIADAFHRIDFSIFCSRQS